jgi:hypothetical protein
VVDAENGPVGEILLEEDAAFIAAWNPTTALSILARLKAAETEVERLNAACREQFEAATHNAQACSELTRRADAIRRRSDNYWETLRSIREFARAGDCERIVLWVNDAGSGFVESAEQTLGVWIDRATTAEALAKTQAETIGELVGVLKLARNQAVAFAIDTVGANAAVKSVAYIDAALSPDTGSREG